VRELAAELRTFVNDYLMAEQRARAFSELMISKNSAPTYEDYAVHETQNELLSQDRSFQLTSDYQSKFVARAVSMRHELMERIPFPFRVGRDASEKGNTFFEMYEVADDLDALAEKVPERR
jgi:hypothetical protein